MDRKSPKISALRIKFIDSGFEFDRSRGWPGGTSSAVKYWRVVFVSESCCWESKCFVENRVTIGAEHSKLKPVVVASSNSKVYWPSCIQSGQL